MKNWLTPAEVAALVGVSKATVLRRIHAGDLPAVIVSPRCFRVRLTDVLELLGR